MRRMFAASVGALLLLVAIPAAIGLADDPVQTTVVITQDPAFVYLYDAVTITATVTPNPGGGTVQFLSGPDQVEQNADVDQVTGAASVTIPSAMVDGNGTSYVHAWFRGTTAFASSETSSDLDVRFLPSIAIVGAPPAFSASASAMVSFTPDTATDCSLDGGVWASCSSPWTAAGLAEGNHTLDIRTYASDGRPGLVATATWMVDLAPPVPGGITINGGAATTNENAARFDYPATDARSGIAFVILSSTGLTDADGDLVGPVDPFAHSTIIPWADGPSAVRNIDSDSPSGPRTYWIQWVDKAGNRSPIRSASIDVRVAHIVLAGGAWQTPNPMVAFAIGGVDPGEIKALRLSNGPGDEAVADFSSPPATWSVTDPAADGTPGEGLKIVYFRWQDAAGVWSVQGVGTIVYSTAGRPDVVLNDGLAVSASPSVPVRFIVPSVSSPVGDPYFAYSCDQTHWAAYTLVWVDLTVDLTNADAGCPPGDGPRSIGLRWGIFGQYTPPPSEVVTIDALWSQPHVAPLVLDHTADVVAPRATAPLARLGTGLFGDVRLTWTGSDAGSGIDRYEISRSTDGGGWVALGSSHGAATTVHAATAHTYRFRVRAIDWAGNTGAWMLGSTFKVTGITESSSAVTFSRSWTLRTDPRWWGGRERSTSTAGATASVSFNGRSFAWVGSTGPTRGRARVFVDGVLVATVDLGASSNHSRRIVFARSWATSGHHRIVIQALSTRGRHLVDVDGFVILR